ncbi:MAG: AAA family ATPase [Oscillatoria sp. SIO1A7]|nr:AAA family ATPase [Oscillatoria sp. SIO1A7]
MTAVLSQWTFPFCPDRPSWEIDWDGLMGNFDWLQNLEGCPQNPLYHAEGDVLTHTRMVVEALVKLPDWRSLPLIERSILFAAALLHDVAKPASTKEDEEGQITSRGHVRLGSKMARQILWSLPEPAPFNYREQVVALIRHGGLPIWFLEKPNPQRAIIKASLESRCDRIALLAEADLRGRLCSDRQELLDRIELFRDFCQENNCLDKPWQFPSAHSRFLYFRVPWQNQATGDRSPSYEAFDDTQCEVVLMSGLPASGKNRWIRENLPDWPVISLDALRLEMKVAPDKNQGIVVDRAKEIAREYLRQNRSFVWNATNISRSLRSSLIDLFAAYRARIRIVYLEAPLPELLRRNRQRTAPIPEAAIRKLAQKLEVPNITEAHQVDWIVG